MRTRTWRQHSIAMSVLLLLVPILSGCSVDRAKPCEQEPLLRFMKAGKWGFLDHGGRSVVPPKYDLVYEYTDSMSLVVVDGLHGFVNDKGQETIAVRYEQALNFTEGLATVLVDGKWGYIDRKGGISIEPQFDTAWQFSDGLASVGLDGLGGYIDHDGKIAIELRFGWAGNFQDGLAPVSLLGDGMAVIDRAGTVVLGPGLEFAGKPRDGLVPIRENGVAHFVDRDGNPVVELPGSVVIADPFHEGHAKVNDNDDRWGFFSSWGYVDGRGNLVVDHRFDEATDFSEGIAAVNFSREYTMNIDLEGSEMRSQGFWGYIDAKGKTVIESQFTVAQQFRCGIALVTIGDNAGYIDRSGAYLWNLASVKPLERDPGEDVIWINE